MIFKTLLLRMMYPGRYSSDVYIKTLKEKFHIDIGSHCKFFAPRETSIDTQRPHMLHIGDYVKFTSGVTVLCHDYSRSTFVNMTEGVYSNVGEAKFTYIGDNVFLGINAIVLMGAHIGNNCVVGAGSVVAGSFPNGVVIAGNPAKIICTIDEFYEKRKKQEIDAAKNYVKKWREKYGKNPSIYDMTNAFSWLYLPHTKETMEQYSQLFLTSAVDEETYLQNYYGTSPLYESFEDFLKDCGDCT